MFASSIIIIHFLFLFSLDKDKTGSGDTANVEVSSINPFVWVNACKSYNITIQIRAAMALYAFSNLEYYLLI